LTRPNFDLTEFDKVYVYHWLSWVA